MRGVTWVYDHLPLPRYVLHGLALDRALFIEDFMRRVERRHALRTNR